MFVDHLNWVGGWIHSQPKTSCKEEGKYRETMLIDGLVFTVTECFKVLMGDDCPFMREINPSS